MHWEGGGEAGQAGRGPPSTAAGAVRPGCSRYRISNGLPQLLCGLADKRRQQHCTCADSLHTCDGCYPCCPHCPVLQDVVSAVSDSGLLERVSKIMGYINQTSGAQQKQQQQGQLAPGSLLLQTCWQLGVLAAASFVA